MGSKYPLWNASKLKLPLKTSDEKNKMLNIFFVLIKFEIFKFSPYLILIAFLVPIKIIYM